MTEPIQCGIEVPRPTKCLNKLRSNLKGNAILLKRADPSWCKETLNLPGKTAILPGREISIEQHNILNAAECHQVAREMVLRPIAHEIQRILDCRIWILLPPLACELGLNQPSDVRNGSQAIYFERQLSR